MSAWGSVEDHPRRIRQIADGRSRRARCRFCSGGRNKRTHIGVVLGVDDKRKQVPVAMMSGCEWHVRMWVKNPASLQRSTPGGSHG